MSKIFGFYSTDLFGHPLTTLTRIRPIAFSKKVAAKKYSKNTKKNEEKPIPEKVLNLLYKRRNKLIRKIEKLEREKDNCKNKKAYKKRLISMKNTLESLENQLEDNHLDLKKELKKRNRLDEQPEIVSIVDDLVKEDELTSFKRKLKERAEQASQTRNECLVQMTA